ncbi:MAG: MgtC/SapB family protein [Clostridia bacterium]|nr:MgtC/SapB family protein [Clostridia bacterium]
MFNIEGTLIIDPIAKLLGDWSIELNVYSATLRILLAFILAGTIGIERARKRHSAGLRTFILVSLASTMAMIIDIYCGINGYFKGLVIISAATVIGIAIISSNSLLYSSKNQIKGLTTAVALWSVSFIGLAMGAGFYTVGLVGYLLVFFCLAILPDVEAYLKNRSNHFEIHLELKNKSDLQDFLTTIRKLGLNIDDIEANPAYQNSGLSVYSISITITKENLRKYKSHAAIIEALSSLEYISYICEIV